MLRSIHPRLGVVVSWSCLLLLACLSIPRIASAQSADDDAAIRMLVEKFFDLYQKKDLDALMALWSEKSPEFATRRQQFQQTFPANKFQLRSLTILKIDANADRATIRAIAEIEAEDVKTGKAADGFGVMNRTFHLLREGEVWKIWQYVATEYRLAVALLSAKTDKERKALLAAQKEMVTDELVRDLVLEGRRFEGRSEYSAALNSYELALSLAEQLHYLIGTAIALRSIAFTQYIQGSYALALEHYQRSLKISEELSDKRGIAITLNNLGNVCRSQGNYSLAFEHYQRSLKIREEIGDKDGIAIMLNNIGLIHNSQGNYALALEHFQRSLKTTEELGDKLGTAIRLGNMGNVHYLQGSYTLALRVDRFYGRVTQKDIDFPKFAKELYDLLIGPARADLKNKSSLIVVPDGVLWQVPFQALQSSVNRFLIQDFTISYAPSLTVLREMMNAKQKRQPASGALSTLVAFGNPDVDPTTVANLQAVYPEVLADERLLPLPQTEILVKTLSRLYGPRRSKVYVRSEAREDRAKKEAANCRILQFATHGILDNTNPMYSRLVMSQSGVDEHEDGMLEAWEIMKLDLKAEMVILSACDTARGRVAGGEGMIGLAWAFFVAGCPTTVVSQWPVEVNSTTGLMVEFHKGLKPGIEGRSSSLSKAGALRAAVMKLMRNPRYRHPFYWAPFVVIGDGR